MRVLKERYIARAISCLAILCLSMSVGAEQKQDQDYETAKTMYLQAYSMTTRADEFRDEREWSEAIKLYRAANDIYALLRERYPDWKTGAVSNLNQECGIQIAFIEKMISQSKAESADNMSSEGNSSRDAAPKPALKGGDGSDQQDGQEARRRLQDEIDRLMREKNEMQRMIRRIKQEQEKSLARQEREYEDQIADLRKESATLREELAASSRPVEVDPKQSVNRSIVDLTEENLGLNEQLTEALETIRKLRAKSIGFAKLAENYEQLRSENEDMRKREEEGYGKLLEEQKQLWRGKFEEFQGSVADEMEERGKNIEELQQRLNEAQQKIAAREEKVEELAALNSELSARLEKMSGSEEKLTQQQGLIEELRKKMEGMAQDRKQEFERVDADWQKRLEEARSKQADEVEKLQTEREEMRADQRRELERIASIWRERLDKSQIQLQEQDREWKRERREMVEIMDEKYAELQAERDSLAKQLKDLEGVREMVADQKEEIRERREMIESMDEKYAQLQAERDSLAGKIDGLKDIQEKVVSQEREIDELLKRVADLKQDQKQELEDRDARWAERLQQAEVRVREEYAGSEERLQAARERLESLDREWRKRQEAQMQEWRAKFEELGALLEKREGELERSRDELAELKGLYAASESGKLANQFAEERERNASKMAAVREAMMELKRERDLASSEKFDLEGKLMQLERKYRKLLKRVED